MFCWTHRAIGRWQLIALASTISALVGFVVQVQQCHSSRADSERISSGQRSIKSRLAEVYNALEQRVDAAQTLRLREEYPLGYVLFVGAEKRIWPNSGPWWFGSVIVDPQRAVLDDEGDHFTIRETYIYMTRQRNVFNNYQVSVRRHPGARANYATIGGIEIELQVLGTDPLGALLVLGARPVRPGD